MKKTFIGFLIAATLVMASCGNNTNTDDSKKEAANENKAKFDSTDMQDDSKFAVTAADAGMLEVQLGTLAQNNGSAPEVINYARMMVEQHGKANEELKKMAAANNITLPQTLSTKSQDTYNDLAKKKGQDFDKAYTSLMVKGHKENIDVFTKESKKGNIPALQGWATDKLPLLTGHLQLAQAADSVAWGNKP